MNPNLHCSGLPRKAISKKPLNFAVMVAAGLVAITMVVGCYQSTGQIIVWGDNSYGQTNAPSDVANVVALVAGDSHGVALKADGTVVAWGGNYSGQTNVPPDLTNVVSIAAGSTHSLALRNDGTVAMWGHLYNSSISTVPPNVTNVVALALGPGATHGLVLRSDGTPVDWGGYYTSANIPPNARNIVQVAAGSLSASALRSDGTVVQWGSGFPGALTPVPASATNIVAIASGWSGYAALRSDGTVLVWGSANVPQSNFSDLLDLACPMNAVFANCDVLALKRNGTVMEYSGSAPIYPPLSVSAIAAGSYNGLAAVGNGPPVFPGLPVNRTVAVDSMAYFRAVAAGAMPISYQWSCNGTNIPGATNSVLVVGPVQPEQAGNAYSLTASNSLGMATNGVMMLYEEPLEATVEPPILAILPGTNATLSADVVGHGPFAYQWQFNGTNLDSATNSALALTNVQLAQTGFYSVVVTNVYGAVTSSVTSVSVVPALITTQPQTQTVPAGTNVSFTVAATGQQPFGYQWRLNGTNLIGATDAALVLTNVQLSQTGYYSVQVSNVWGAVTSSIALLMVKPLLITSGPYSQSVTAGSNATFSITLAGQSPFSYQWLWNGTNLLGETNAALVLTNVQFSQSGNYSVIVSNAFGSVTSPNPTLNVFALKITGQPQSQAVLPGANATFAVTASGQAPLTYQWVCNGSNIVAATNNSLTLTNLQLGQGGNLFVTVSNAYGFTNSSLATLSVLPALITSQPKDVTVVAGGLAAFSVLTSSGPAVSYQWLFNSTNLNGATARVLSLSGVKMNQAGLYACVVTNTYGAVTSSPAWLNVIPLTINSAPHNTSVLAGANASFNVTAAGQQPIFYQWQFNGSNLPNATNAALLVTNVQPDQAGTYSVIVSNQFSTIISNAQLVVIPIKLTFPLQNQVGFRGGNVTFSVVAQSQPISYQWQFNGTNLAVPNTNTLNLTNVQYNQAGIYSVIISNAFGGTNSSASLAVVPVAVFGDIAGTVPGSVSNLLAVAAGGSHDLGLKADGTVTAWGNQTFVPSGLSNVVALAAGQNYSLALLADGTVTAWGDNTYGETNVPTGLTNVVAVAAAGVHNLALKNDGAVVAWGDNSYGQTNVPAGLSNVVAIAAGFNHCLALGMDGTLTAWGDNTYGQTNVPIVLSNVVGIASGYYHNLALLTDGTVTAWGQDPYGQTDVPVGLSNVVAIACGTYHSLALQADGQLTAWGYNVHGEATIPPGLTNVVGFGGGYYHSVALLGEQPPPTQALAKSSGMVSSVFTLQIPTQSGRVYALQYKNSLSDAAWVSLPLTAGNGGMLTLKDQSATNSLRFYRVSRW